MEGVFSVAVMAGPSEQASEFVALSNESVLKSMRDAGLTVRKACRNGVCAICRCKLISGEISYGQRQPFGLWDKDITEGYILPCIAEPRTDLVVDELTLELDVSKAIYD